ncbi:hypothetical protein L0B53_04580 [Vibrio sp. SS-MA-C1-2]|uniref:DUF6931 family protein n=1 Tax=Vibrio sp. SS-MA-C1-2 TaxID=2908646 RepID=UPI001F28FFED|nr:hypothetical protein [Vibrio sp. SS-MA-C1-2]UJF17197.1 hypothetical protein L0B53_04580 [Vibrio sp. SS-MA-C1-2]
MKKMPYKNSVSICSRFEFSEDAAMVVDVESLPEAVMKKLFESQQYIDLMHFIAHALPMRESIWFAAKALKLRENDWSQQEVNTLNQVMQWIMEPNETLRRQIESQILVYAETSAAKWLGQAVVWSGTGSIAPIDSPMVMPADFLYAKAVAGAVNTAAVLPEWQGREKYYTSTFDIALDISKGGSGNI